MKKKEPISLERLCEIFDEHSRPNGDIGWRSYVASDLEIDVPLMNYWFDSMDVTEIWEEVETEIGRKIDIDLDVTKTCRELHRMICEAVQ